MIAENFKKNIDILGARKLVVSSESTILDKNWCSQNRISEENFEPSFDVIWKPLLCRFPFAESDECFDMFGKLW